VHISLWLAGVLAGRGRFELSTVLEGFGDALLPLGNQRWSYDHASIEARDGLPHLKLPTKPTCKSEADM
jgi:hypothetical protein